MRDVMTKAMGMGIVAASLAFGACAEPVDEATVLNERELPGEQSVGSSDAFHRGCASVEPNEADRNLAGGSEDLDRRVVLCHPRGRRWALVAAAVRAV